MLGRCNHISIYWITVILLKHTSTKIGHITRSVMNGKIKEEGGILFFWLSQFQLPASETKQNIAINLPHSLIKQFNSSSLAVERIMKSCTSISAQNSTKYILRLREKRQQKHLKPRYGKPLVLSTLGPCKSQRIEKDFI